MVENYIVRIYQRDEQDTTKIAGMVEVAGTQEKKPFSNVDELLKILSSLSSSLETSRKTKKKVTVGSHLHF